MRGDEADERALAVLDGGGQSVIPASLRAAKAHRVVAEQHRVRAEIDAAVERLGGHPDTLTVRALAGVVAWHRLLGIELACGNVRDPSFPASSEDTAAAWAMFRASRREIARLAGEVGLTARVMNRLVA